MSFVPWWDREKTVYYLEKAKSCCATREANEAEGYVHHVCCHGISSSLHVNEDLRQWGEDNLLGDAKVIYTNSCCLISTKIESDALLCKLVWG